MNLLSWMPPPLGDVSVIRLSRWSRIKALTFGMVTVLRIVRESRSHKVTVSPRTMPFVVSNDNTTSGTLQRWQLTNLQAGLQDGNGNNKVGSSD